ncbi:hypothetical protein Tco_1313108 [Tanacetum coccineum]
MAMVRAAFGFFLKLAFKFAGLAYLCMISFEVYDHLILSAFVFGDEYSICSRGVIMEKNGVLHAMLRQVTFLPMLCDLDRCDIDVWTKSEGLLAGIYGLFSGRYCGLVRRRVICGYPWPGLGETTWTLLAMPSHFYKKFRWGTVFATGRRSFIELGTGLRMKRTNRRSRVSIDLYPCHIEKKMTIKEVRGESVMKWKIKVTTKDGIVIKFPGKFHGYKLAMEEEVEENEGLKEVWEQMQYVISDSASDLESTASS